MTIFQDCTEHIYIYLCNYHSHHYITVDFKNKKTRIYKSKMLLGGNILVFYFVLATFLSQQNIRAHDDSNVSYATLLEKLDPPGKQKNKYSAKVYSLFNFPFTFCEGKGEWMINYSMVFKIDLL